ncbi:carboxypeptidase-like regulatory domain-containing protein [Flavobacterium sp. CGRL2]
MLDDEKQPVIGANVYITELQTGTVTDINGKYSIEVPNGAYTVSISYVGFQNKERQININDDTTLNFNIESDSQQLGEVIVMNNKAVDVKTTQMSVNRLSMQEIKKNSCGNGRTRPFKIDLNFTWSYECRRSFFWF